MHFSIFHGFLGHPDKEDLGLEGGKVDEKTQVEFYVYLLVEPVVNYALWPLSYALGIYGFRFL